MGLATISSAIRIRGAWDRGNYIVICADCPKHTVVTPQESEEGTCACGTAFRDSFIFNPAKEEDRTAYYAICDGSTILNKNGEC